ncbi:MAG: DUF362 domain-containing protein [Candidatus Latescibacterota bacterium]|nr:MAG: DUF362 domain-containing protein [Candidatus Latescibacterota bacterium]
MAKNALTRREFLKATSSAALAGAVFMNTSETVHAEQAKKTRVILVRDKTALDTENKPNGKVLADMLDKAVTKLVDAKSPDDAWSQIIQPDDVVGIKTNVWGYLPTPEALNKTIGERCQTVGVKKENISARDRGLLDDDVFVNATALINIRPARTHHWSGVGSLLKNYITFVREPWKYHDDSCADLAKLWELSVCKGKTRLNVLVVLTPLFHGVGPHHYNPEFTWAYKGLLVGFDPVAVDATGVRLLMARREVYFEEERPLDPPAKHVFLADTRHHMGTADPGKIELVKIGWQDDILI